RRGRRAPGPSRGGTGSRASARALGVGRRDPRLDRPRARPGLRGAAGAGALLRGRRARGPRRRGRAGPLPRRLVGARAHLVRRRRPRRGAHRARRRADVGPRGRASRADLRRRPPLRGGRGPPQHGRRRRRARPRRRGAAHAARVGARAGVRGGGARPSRARGAGPLGGVGRRGGERGRGDREDLERDGRRIRRAGRFPAAAPRGGRGRPGSRVTLGDLLWYVPLAVAVALVVGAAGRFDVRSSVRGATKAFVTLTAVVLGVGLAIRLLVLLLV